HARVLTAEIAYRKGVERSLRESVRELRAAEAEREDLLERERVANRAKDEFLAMLGHELRNPLSPLVSALELLKLRLGDAGLREREIIERQTRLLVRLVDDLLDVSRITRGRIALRPASL